jgi:F420-non-reducing hydrogenase iron-sulfur subunit
MAGVSRLQYRTEARLIRVMCSGRVDLDFVLRAFSNGMDGVFIGGCRLNECNYITHGNFHALNMALLFKKIMKHIGLDPERLRIEFMSSGEGQRFTEVLNDFSRTVEKLGPLGSGEGISRDRLEFELKAVKALVPYLRLVQAERLRANLKTEEEYKQFFDSQEADRLFNELVANKLAISRILLLLRERPHSTAEISEILSLNPSEVSKHLINSSMQGFVRYDEDRKRYAAA